MELFKLIFADKYYKVGNIVKGWSSNNYAIVLDNGEENEVGDIIYSVGGLKVSKWKIIRWFQLRVLKSVL